MSDLLSGFLGWDKKPDIMDPTQGAYPPPPKPTYQDKPTHFEATGLKYNAYNIDKLSVDITSKTGFNNITPDMLVWNQYHYNVQELVANADEEELSKFLNWALEGSGVDNFKVDFSKGGETKVSGKYKGLIPFSVDISIYQSTDNKLVFSFDKVKALVPIPDTIRDVLIDSLLDIKDMPDSLIQLKPAFVKVGDSKIVFDPSRINPKVNFPIKFFETTDSSMKVAGGTKFFEQNKPTAPKLSEEGQREVVNNFFKQGSVSEQLGVFKEPATKATSPAPASKNQESNTQTKPVADTNQTKPSAAKPPQPAKQSDTRINDLMNIEIKFN